MSIVFITGCSTSSRYDTSVPTEPPYLEPPLASGNPPSSAYNVAPVYYNPPGYKVPPVYHNPRVYSEPPLAAVNPPPAVYNEPSVEAGNPPSFSDNAPPVYNNPPLYSGPPVSAINPPSSTYRAPPASDRNPSNVNLPDGTGNCIQGFVWREAFPGDHVCVTTYTRSKVANDNDQASLRKQPEGGSYGPDTCREGFVWREARPDDHVCVSPQTRTQTAYDNSQASVRRVMQ
jgi:hypothetical protein